MELRSLCIRKEKDEHIAGQAGENHFFRPLDRVPALYADADNRNCLGWFEWGFLPEREEVELWRGRLYNIRVESIEEGMRGEYARALRCRRAIVPAAELVEEEIRGGRRSGRRFLVSHSSRQPLYLAALYSLRGPLKSVGLLTVGHSRFGRFPLLFSFSDACHRWLDGSLGDGEEIRNLLDRPSLQELAYVPLVSDWFVSPRPGGLPRNTQTSLDLE